MILPSKIYKKTDHSAFSENLELKMMRRNKKLIEGVIM